MKVCYIVYREDNVMVFDSQVLEYLYSLRQSPEIEEVTLVLFRHEDNLFKRNEVEKKIHNYVDNCRTFSSFPVLLKAQLVVNSSRLKKFVSSYYGENEQVAVICRGDLAACIAAKAFSGMKGSRILFDNRGLAYEESLMTHGNSRVHKKNREIKKFALEYAKSHCDMYNFVTTPMREYFIAKYKYDETLPYTVIPTLYHAEKVDQAGLENIKKRENYKDGDHIVTYVGSTAAWQSTEQLVYIIEKIAAVCDNARFFVLTNGNVAELQQLSQDVQKKIVLKSVPHSEMKYYLTLSNIGIVIRNDNIVNRVAAPTKIAEYLTSGLTILYSGDIGIISDIRNKIGTSQLIEMDAKENWLKQLAQSMADPRRHIDSRVVSYFDMQTRQRETIKMLETSFNNEKVR